jgi:hypothetical protein
MVNRLCPALDLTAFSVVPFFQDTGDARAHFDFAHARRLTDRIESSGNLAWFYDPPP